MAIVEERNREEGDCHECGRVLLEQHDYDRSCEALTKPYHTMIGRQASKSVCGGGCLRKKAVEEGCQQVAPTRRKTGRMVSNHVTHRAIYWSMIIVDDMGGVLYSTHMASHTKR